MELLGRVVDPDAHGATIDTLEGVTYLLQRMMVSLQPGQSVARRLLLQGRGGEGTPCTLLRNGGVPVPRACCCGEGARR